MYAYTKIFIYIYAKDSISQIQRGIVTVVKKVYFLYHINFIIEKYIFPHLSIIKINAKSIRIR